MPESISSSGKSELQILKEKANEVTDETLDSTRRMVQYCEQSKDTGLQALVALDGQGEKLEQIEDGMDGIQEDIRVASENLSGMEKCCGLCNLPWKKETFFKKGKDTWPEMEDNKVVSNQPKRIIVDQSGKSQSGYISRISNDAREEEMDKNLARVDSCIGNLRNMAIDISNEVDSQNEQIKRIVYKADTNTSQISNANQRAIKILNKT